MTVIPIRGEPPLLEDNPATRRQQFCERLLGLWRRYDKETRLKKGVRSLLDAGMTMARVFTETRLARMNSRDRFEATFQMAFALAQVFASETQDEFRSRFAQVWNHGWAD